MATVSVATLVKPYGWVDTDTDHDCSDIGGDFPPDIQAFWDGLSPTEKQFPFVGYETWRNQFSNCTTSRVDAYHGLFTFDLMPLSNLRGLVVSAELVVSTRAVPPPFPSFPGGVSGGILGCQAFTGGASTLQRFGPAAAGTLPAVSGAGTLDILQADPLPIGDVVFTIARPWVAGPVAGATSPTSTVASGTGGATFTVDVTNPVNAALNSGAAGMSWALAPDFVGPLDRAVPNSARKCKTPFEMQLRITHH